MSDQDARERALARVPGTSHGKRDRDSWVGEEAAIYCRMSHARDEDQTGVDRQERICRRIAKRLGLAVAARNVFIDNNRSAWQRNRKRKGWDALLEAARSEGIRHVIAYHPDRLMRQPRDLEELLAISDEHGITLHGEANQRDLSDPDDRFFLRIEVAHACRSSDDTSRRLKTAEMERARDGRPHPGRRTYGYASDGVTIAEDEAEVVRWIFESFLDGGTPYQMAEELNRQGKRTTNGALWRINAVLKVLDSRHVAGIRVFRGKDIGPGTWEAIIDRGMWEEAQERRSHRSAIVRQGMRPGRFYLLRGVIWCAKCGRRMVGKNLNGRPAYICNNHITPDRADRCYRTAGAAYLEAFVKDAAINLLERLDVTGRETSSALSDTDNAAIEADHAELAELKAMWDSQEIRTSEYRQMRKAVEDRIKRIQAKTVVRPAAEVLDGMTGPNARATWEALEKAGSQARLNAVLRFLFAAVRIDENRSPNGTFDYGRVSIEQNEL